MSQPGKATRSTSGQFLPGVSGNPDGRPKSEIAELRAILAGGALDVATAVLTAAKSGDMTAAKIVFDRLLPPLKATAAPVQVPLPDGADPLSIARLVLTAAAAGTLPPDIAAGLVAAAGTLARVEELEELKDRLAAIEKAVSPPNRKP